MSNSRLWRWPRTTMTTTHRSSRHENAVATTTLSAARSFDEIWWVLVAVAASSYRDVDRERGNPDAQARTAAIGVCRDPDESPRRCHVRTAVSESPPDPMDPPCWDRLRQQSRRSRGQSLGHKKIHHFVPVDSVRNFVAVDAVTIASPCESKSIRWLMFNKYVKYFVKYKYRKIKKLVQFFHRKFFNAIRDLSRNNKNKYYRIIS